MTPELIEATQSETIASLEASGRPRIDAPTAPRAVVGAPFSKRFDHTLLKADADAAQYRDLCAAAVELDTWSVCVPPDRVTLCARELRETAVAVCTVIGFPFGYHASSAKVAEVSTTGEAGATEFDMVLAIGRLRDGDIGYVYDDVRAVVAAAGSHIVKVILETALLDDRQRIVAATVAIHAGASFIKTSTGFNGGGASVEDLEMFRLVAGETRGVKASGGVRTAEFARACIAAGADRIGASATAAILAGAAVAGDDGY